jgi:hypothetical protein
MEIWDYLQRERVGVCVPGSNPIRFAKIFASFVPESKHRQMPKSFGLHGRMCSLGGLRQSPPICIKRPNSSPSTRRWSKFAFVVGNAPIPFRFFGVGYRDADIRIQQKTSRHHTSSRCWMVCPGVLQQGNHREVRSTLQVNPVTATAMTGFLR